MTGRARTSAGPGLVLCLAYAALTGGVVAGLGNPLIYQVSVTRDVPIVDAQWMLIVTLVVGAVGTPVVARLSDGRTRKAVLVGTLLVIAAGSAIALLPSFPALLVARAAQGFGYALVPLTVSVAREHLEGPALARTLAVLSVSVAAGVGIGNPAIGLLVAAGGYRLPFLLAVLVAGTAAWWVARRIPSSRAEERPVELDLPGAALLTAGLGSLLLAVARGEVWGWSSTPVLVLGAVGLLLLAAWWRLESVVAAPLVDLRLATSPGALGVNLVALLLGIGMFGGASAVMLFVQSPAEGAGLGESVFVAGLLMMPMALASLVMPSIGLRLARRVGHRSVLAAGAVLVSSSFACFAAWHRHVGDVAAMMLLMGLGIGLAYSVMPAVIVSLTPPERTGSAMGVNQVVRMVGGSAGGAVVAALLAAHTAAGAHDPGESGFVLAGAFAAFGALLAGGVAIALVPARVVVPESPERADRAAVEAQPPPA